MKYRDCTLPNGIALYLMRPLLYVYIYVCVCCFPAGIKTVVRLLGEKDEGIVGNAALCLSHCTQVRGACAAMVNTEVVKESLIWARDGKNVSAQKNCAILLGKLATGHKK